MIIGIDFDNTIVRYDKTFYDVALKRNLITRSVPKVKEDIRNYLRRCGKEHMWTELQGFVYGPGILKAKPFNGVINFFLYCKKHNIDIYIISHKTLYPYLGFKYNLHRYAFLWLDKQGFFSKIGLTKKDVFFEKTKEDKLKRIIKQKCTYYIDDLPEFLLEKNFPSKVTRILFDPNSKYKHTATFERVKSWTELIKKVK